MSNFEIPNDDAMRQVWNILSIRYGIFPKQGMRLVGEWFQQNPGETTETLKQALISGKILVKEGKLLDLRQISQTQIEQLVATLRGKGGVEIKDRWYRTRKYPCCFVGSEAVSCLQKAHGASEAEALRLGQLLIENKVLHHVLDEHSFKNEALFYRFYSDES